MVPDIFNKLVQNRCDFDYSIWSECNSSL